MRALTVHPGRPDSLSLDELDTAEDGAVLVDVVAVGVCGTDLEIVAGDYGEAPPGRDRLVLGHESLGRVRQAPAGTDLAPGDAVVAIVRHPDPVPCGNCAVGQWDMCRNGGYTEHGIKGRDGFLREQFRADAERLVRVDRDLGVTGVLLEPASIVAKAWAEIDRTAARAAYRPRVALVTGAGPVGLLAALLGVQRGLEVHVVDVVTDGPKPDLVTDLGAAYHASPLEGLDVAPDVVVECTGVPTVVLAAMRRTAVDGITCLTGVSAPGRQHQVDVGELNRTLVLENDVVFGSVNANRTHYEAASAALNAADRSWLDRLLTRRVALGDYRDAFDRRPDDVKVVIEIGPVAGP